MSYYISGFDENGKPYSVSGDSTEKVFDRELISDLEPWEQKIVIHWIAKSFYATKTELPTCTSYGLKHILQNDLGIYLTNNQFKDAMLICGFYPVDEKELNWTYRISKRSPAFYYGDCRKVNGYKKIYSLNIYSLIDEIKNTSKKYSDCDKESVVTFDNSHYRVKK